MRWCFRIVATLTLWASSGTEGPIRFEEIAHRSGLRFVTDSCPTPRKNQPETMVSGVGLFDYDGDGFLDVYFVNGADIPSLVKKYDRYFNRLFHNNRDLTFTDVTARAGVAGTGYGMGVAAADYDNDGRVDFYVANVTGNQLFHNNGDGTFTDVAERAGVTGGVLDGRKMWSVAAAWVDYNNDGKLDLFVSNYCKWEPNKDPECVGGPRVRAYCHPKFYEALPNTLYRNNGDGTFTDVSVETGIAKHRGKGMGIGIADYDNDGYPDIFVANDNAPNFLFHNLGGKKFEQVALDALVAFPETGHEVSGMGAEFKDLDNDGRPDIWHTAIEHETFPLFLNQGSGLFLDVTRRSGLAGATASMSGWSNGAFDFDNDGWKDLFAARSNVLDNSAIVSNRDYFEPNAVLRNLGKGKFQDVSGAAGPDFQQPAAHRGAAFGDLDNDGRIDAVVTVLGGEAKLFHNISPGGNHWVLLRLVGTRSNRMGIGARIRLTGEDGRTQYNHVTTSSGFAASSDPRVHFGLGSASRIRELEVLWPSGIRQVVHDVVADRAITIQEPAL